MAKLSKEAAKLHNQAMALVKLDRPLSEEEKRFVLDNFHEGATNMNSLAGAFFTPAGLARDFAMEVPGGAVVDLCAGIGRLSFELRDKAKSLVCVEYNPEYLAVGKKVVPEATWILGDVFDVWPTLGKFDVAVSNPPFGAVSSKSYEGPVTSNVFEYRLIEIAARLAKMGVFIVPQTSAPFRLSGVREFRVAQSTAYNAFQEQTGIVLEPNCGIDTSQYLSDWKGVSPVCEIVIADYQACDLVYGKGQSQDLFAA